MKKNVFKVSRRMIWLSSLLLSLLSSVPKIAERPFPLAEAVVNSMITLVFALFVWYYNLYSFPDEKNRTIGFSVRHLVMSLLLGLVVMFVLACVQQLILSHIHFGPVMLMVETRGILINVMFYMFLHLLYQSYQTQQVGVELERIKSDHLEAQFELLRQQVNPHFLFNSLNTLKSMVESEDEHSVEFILKLSDFYRYTLESRKLDLIPLTDELEIIQSYLFLLKARFDAGIDLTTQVSEATQHSLIPPFTLQLLVENCTKHNVVSLEKPLHIRIYEESGFLVVENDIQLKRGQVASTKMGLENINTRYTHLVEQTIRVESDTDVFRVKLPIIASYSRS
ncbi:sensor histidine kinase [Siphonobacter sp.]|uniref:sensor histidine kinase n=1 Tax=Siphonobacter sp. TaxID=1869184 RepID=UPI003B3A741F